MLFHAAKIFYSILDLAHIRYSIKQICMDEDEDDYLIHVNFIELKNNQDRNLIDVAEYGSIWKGIKAIPSTCKIEVLIISHAPDSTVTNKRI